MSGMVAMVVDIETLGSGPRAEIIQIGAVAQPMVGTDASQRHCWSVRSGQRGREIDMDTMAWWVDDMERVGVLRQILCDSGRVDLMAALSELSRWAERFPVAEWWSFGQFDFPILEDAYRQIGIHVPWDYRRLRDLRTLLDVTGVEMDRNRMYAHNALSDAVAEADALRKAWEKVRNWRKEAAK